MSIRSIWAHDDFIFILILKKLNKESQIGLVGINSIDKIVRRS